MNKVISRLLTFFIGIPLVLFIVFFNFMNHLPLHIALSIFSVIGANELYEMIAKDKKLFPKEFILISTAILTYISYAFILCERSLEITPWIYVAEIIIFMGAEAFIAKEFNESLTKIVYNIVKNEFGTIDKKYKDIVDVVLELAIQNELYYRLSGKSTFQEGDSSLTYLKRQIYPYFLMYLGAEKEDFTSYMMRDGITFDIEKYQVIEKLKSMNLLDFIEFCIEYQWKIVRINQLEII